MQVTPYASTLMDLVLEKSSGNHSEIKCKKVYTPRKNIHFVLLIVGLIQVYFLWICPSHKNFEWFVDVLKSVETYDTDGILVQQILFPSRYKPPSNLKEIHIFVTQFFHKFDLRTTVLVSAFGSLIGNNLTKLPFQYICEKHFRGDNRGLRYTTIQKPSYRKIKHVHWP